MVMTVSRCMNARFEGNATGITVVAAPLAKRLRARASTACGVVRSPMPMSTAPRPITRTSPPSMVAEPWSSSTPPYQRAKDSPAKSGWKR